MDEERDEELVLRESELAELLDRARRDERARAVQIVLEELGSGELAGIICAEIDEGVCANFARS